MSVLVCAAGWAERCCAGSQSLLVEPAPVHVATEEVLLHATARADTLLLHRPSFSVGATVA